MTDEQQITELAKLDKWEVTSRTLVLSGGMDEEGSGKTVLQDCVLKHNHKFVEAFNWNLNSVPTLNDCLQTIIARTPYLTSRDAIVPVIEKVIMADKEVNHSFPYKLYELLPRKIADENSYTSVMAVLATPRQLCEALLRATGKWKE